MLKPLPEEPKACTQDGGVPCACADVLAAASNSHSGAIVSIKPAMLKEAVCFLLVTEIRDFILRSLQRSLAVGSGGVAEMEAVGFWPWGSERCRRRRSGSVRPTAINILFAS